MRLLRPTTRLAVLILLCAGLSYAQSPCPTPAPQATPSGQSLNQFPNRSPLPNKSDRGRKLLIIADNQEHLLTGGPLRSMGRMSEKYVASFALRSPLANVGGLQLLKEVLRFGRREGVEMVLHLGDAADISCQDELSSVFSVLEAEAKGIWFMTPGNHDGLLAGNHGDFQPRIDFDISKWPWVYTMPPVQGPKGMVRSWLNACLSPTNLKDKTSGADILTKGDMVRLYWDELKERSQVAPEKLKPEEILFEINGKKEYLDRVEISDTLVQCPVERMEIKSQGYAGIARICPRTRVSGKAGDKDGKWVGPYASFIVQKIDLKATTIILLDTSYYLNPTARNVALDGSITEYQMKLAEKFVLPVTHRNNLIFAGHHPFDDLPDDEQRWVAKYASRYMSAHVHRTANLIKHRVNGDEILELNVGSTLDFPPQAVIAGVTPTAMSFRVAGADVAKTGWPAFLEKCEKNRAEWMLNPEFYSHYTSDPYVKHLLESLREAESVRRASAVVGSGPELEIPAGTKPRDWLLLDLILQRIRNDTSKSGIFWACQAYYASEATQREIGWGDRVLNAFGLGAKAGCEATGSEFPFLPPGSK
jgi:hypothetical protein